MGHSEKRAGQKDFGFTLRLHYLPHKKPKGGELNEIQQDRKSPCLLSSSRVVCENAFAGIKRYGAVSQIYRNRAMILMTA